MKKSILFLTTMLSVVLLHAQTTETNENNPYNLPLSNEEFFKQAEIVFEGYFIKTVAGYDPEGNATFWGGGYRIDIYKVQRVYKGTQYAVGDTIYIVEKGGYPGIEKGENPWHQSAFKFSDGDNPVIVPEVLWKNGISWNPKQEQPLIYFLVSSDFPDDENSKYFSYKKYMHFHPESMNLCMYISGDNIAGLNDLVFRKREDFYNYMRQFEGFTVPETEPKMEKQPNH
jgi:hypothetical protein